MWHGLWHQFSDHPALSSEPINSVRPCRCPCRRPSRPSPNGLSLGMGACTPHRLTGSGAGKTCNRCRVKKRDRQTRRTPSSDVKLVLKAPECLGSASCASLVKVVFSLIFRQASCTRLCFFFLITTVEGEVCQLIVVLKMCSSQ